MPTVENIDLEAGSGIGTARQKFPDGSGSVNPAYNDEIEDLLVLGSAALLSKFRGNVYLLTPHHHLREGTQIR
jgi:hypothetical protein